MCQGYLDHHGEVLGFALECAVALVLYSLLAFQPPPVEHGHTLCFCFCLQVAVVSHCVIQVVEQEQGLELELALELELELLELELEPNFLQVKLVHAFSKFLNARAGRLFWNVL